MLIPGTDWAHWQGSIDFHKMASQGVRVGFGKVSQGRTPDPKWTTYARAAKAAGLFVGGYLFLDATSTASAAEQASLFLSQLAKGAPNMIHMYDAEWDGGWSDGDAARIAYYRDVMNRVDGALGRKGPIYTIKSFWRDYCANTTAFLDHEMIVAAPLNGMPPVNAGDWDTWAEGRGPEEPKYWAVGSWAKWGGWQFAVPAGSGPTYGVQSSAIDMDLYDPATIARWTDQPNPGDDMGAPYALISAGGVTYAVASDLQSKLGLNASTLKASQQLLALSGFPTTVLAASGDILNLINSIPLTTDDATAAQVAAVGTQVSSLNTHLTAQDTAASANQLATKTHLDAQDVAIGKIPTGSAPGGGVTHDEVTSIVTAALNGTVLAVKPDA